MPVQTVFDNLEAGMSIDEIVEVFEVTEEEVKAAVHFAAQSLTLDVQVSAYKTMVQFLEDRYNRLPSDELGGLLGELSLLADGKPADPAVASEWQRAADRVALGGTQMAEPIPMRRAG